MADSVHPKRGFFPIRWQGGILIPGDSTELLLADGVARWHRRADWARGQQDLQTSNMPADVVAECVNAIAALLDAAQQVRTCMQAELQRLGQDEVEITGDRIPLASPFEPQKVPGDDTTEIVIPGGYVGEIQVTFAKKLMKDSQGQLRNESAAAWRTRSQATSDIDQHIDVPADVVYDAAVVLERQVDFVTLGRKLLGTLTAS